MRLTHCSLSPYYGQVFWFKNAHPEPVPSAVERYQNEILRVFGVLDGVLAKQPSGWLVGGKLTIADLSFVMWDLAAMTTALKDRPDVDVEKTYPAFYALVVLLLVEIICLTEAAKTGGTRDCSSTSRWLNCWLFEQAS